jgi:hypothetical protein
MTAADFKLVADSLLRSRPQRKDCAVYYSEMRRWRRCVMQLCADFDQAYSNFVVGTFLTDSNYHVED